MNLLLDFLSKKQEYFKMSNHKKHNIYICSNNDRNRLNKKKFGYVEGDKQNLANRLGCSTEQFSDFSYFSNVFTFQQQDKYAEYDIPDKLISEGCRHPEYIDMLENKYETTLPNMKQLTQYLVKGENKYNEFIQDNGLPILIKVLKEEFPKLGLTLVKEYSQTELDEIKNMKKKRKSSKTTNIAKKLRDRINAFKLLRSKKEVIQQFKWLKRKYQEDIITLGKEALSKYNKFYLELATGGGKSYVVYNLLNNLKTNTIIIFSPRKKINQQNGNKKYLSLIDNEYEIFNGSNYDSLDGWLEEKKNKKKIIIACTQSQDKIYEKIKEHEVTDVSIWFDEAHWGIEKWVDAEDTPSKQFFMRDNEIIKKRIFTSASPDNKKIELNEDVFGTLYSPIKVKELINQSWLCPIKTRILEYDNLSLDLCDWVTKEFENLESSFGFSFHSRDDNAFNLFYKHYLKYKNGEITVKPYLLINNGGLNDANRRKLDNSIDLDYNFRDDKSFESSVKSIGYVCKKYDMGYDFSKLDYLVFSDAKMSRQDIIQCIGRGVRPDGKGENGKNKDKILNVMLPVYICEEAGAGEYNNIIEVLRYLVLDLDVDILDNFDTRGGGGSLTRKKSKGVDYKGEQNNSLLYDLLYKTGVLKVLNTKDVYELCIKNNIKTEEEYNNFKDQNPGLRLRDNIYKYDGFIWQNVIDPNHDKYYSTEKELEKAKDNLYYNLDDDDWEEMEEQEIIHGWSHLNTFDNKIPPMKVGQSDHYYK